MIDSIFKQYQGLLNNASGNTLNFKEQISGNVWVEGKITSPNLAIIPTLPVTDTKFSITTFDKNRGRITGIDNHENQSLHEHISGTQPFISGNHTLGTIGSHAFLNFFK